MNIGQFQEILNTLCDDVEIVSIRYDRHHRLDIAILDELGLVRDISISECSFREVPNTKENNKYKKFLKFT